MKPRSSHHRKIKGNKVFIARHFWHFENSGSECGGGESYEHQRMKSIALSKLREIFDYSDSGREERVGEKRADAYVKFPEPRNPYGKGVCAEVQYRHRGKDIEETNEHFLDRGYSVCWLEEGDFHDKDVDILGNILSCWPHAVPTSSTAGPDITKFGGKQKAEGFLHQALIFPEDFTLDSNEPSEILLKEFKLVECSVCGVAKKATKGVDSAGFVCTPCEERRQKEGEEQKGLDEYS